MESGFCKFCGQAFMVDADPGASEAELNELATAKCACDGAVNYAWRNSTLAVFDQDLEVIFGRNNDQMKEILGMAGEMIMGGKIKSMSIRQSEGKTISLSTKEKGLCIKVTEKSTTENVSYG